MSKIVVTLEESLTSLEAIFLVRAVSALRSAAEVKQRLCTGGLLAEYVLFENDHHEAEERLLKLVRALTTMRAKFRIYELEDDETLLSPSAKHHEISVKTLNNILEAHHREIEH